MANKLQINSVLYQFKYKGRIWYKRLTDGFFNLSCLSKITRNQSSWGVCIYVFYSRDKFT